MISFEPSPEELALRDTVHRFAAEKVRPLLRDAEERGVPDRLAREYRDLGLGLLALPAEAGGTDLGVRGLVLIEEELAWGDPGICAAFPRPGLPSYILAHADQPARDRWLPALVDGSSSALAAVLGAGEPDRQTGAVAHRRHGRIVLDGSDLLFGASEGDPPDWFLVAAGLDGDLALVAVGRGVPGGRLVREDNRLGLQALPCARLDMRGCGIDEAAILATGDTAAAALAAGLDRELATWAARAVGTSRAAFEYAARYATERRTFGRPIAEHQAVAFMAAEMGIDVEAVRGVLWHAAWALDSAQPGASDEIRSAAVLAAETAVRVTSDAVQVLGGHGYTQDHPVEKWMRDARTIGNLIGIVLTASARRRVSA